MLSLQLNIILLKYTIVRYTLFGVQYSLPDTHANRTSNDCLLPNSQQKIHGRRAHLLTYGT